MPQSWQRKHAAPAMQAPAIDVRTLQPSKGVECVFPIHLVQGLLRAGLHSPLTVKIIHDITGEELEVYAPTALPLGDPQTGTKFTRKPQHGPPGDVIDVIFPLKKIVLSVLAFARPLQR